MIKDLQVGKSILDHPDGPNAITRISGRRGRGDVMMEAEVERWEDARLLDLKMEGGATRQGTQVVCESWKRQGDRHSPTASGRHQSC